jgi:hypothetical protein
MVNSGSAYGLDDLIDVDLSLSPNTGDVLKWDGDNFIAAAEGAFTPGGNYFIDIIDENDDVILNATGGTFKGNVINTAGETVLSAESRYFKGSIQRLDSPVVIVDAATQNIYADTVYGDLEGNVTGNVNGNVTGNLFANDSTLFIDAATQNIYADTVYSDLYGDVLGNVNGNLTGDVTGNVTGNVQGNVTGNLFTNDSILFIDAATQNIYADTVYGNLLGDVTGDVKGSVFADDSTVLVDSANGLLRGDHVGTLTGNLFTNDSILFIDAATQNIYANIVYGDLYGNVLGNVQGNVTGDVTGNLTGNLTGNVNGTVNGDLIGSVYSDDSTLVIDGTLGKAPLLKCDVANSLVNTTSAIVTNLIINQRTLTDPARNPAMVISSETDGMFDGPFFQMIGYRGSAGIGQQPLQVGDTAGQIRFSSANFGLNENRPTPVVLNTVITEVGNNVTTFTQGKLQVILLGGPDLEDASVTEITKGGVLSTPVLKTGVYADATARDAYFTDRSISPAAGMIVFLTGTTKFQGFNGSTWTDLN